MILAVRTGVPPESWLADTRAMVTANELLRDADARANREARRRRG